MYRSAFDTGCFDIAEPIGVKPVHGDGATDWCLLTAGVQSVDFPRGHRIFTEGELGDCLYVIKAGKVKVGRRSAGGREGLLAVLGPTDMLGELSAFDPGPRTSDATTLTAVRVARVDRMTLRHWMTKRPELADQLLRALARRLRTADDHVAGLVFSDVAGRLAKQLLLLGEKFGRPTAEGLSVIHGLTQEELAQLVGSTRETVNKALVDFTDRGWIRPDYRSTLIIDADRLAKRAL
jgi:CRP/FNR family cyclic AMP-dependent transcriptional regulator